MVGQVETALRKAARAADRGGVGRRLLCFGFCADPAILDDVQTMAGGVEAEAALLHAMDL